MRIKYEIFFNKWNAFCWRNFVSSRICNYAQARFWFHLHWFCWLPVIYTDPLVLSDFSLCKAPIYFHDFIDYKAHKEPGRGLQAIIQCFLFVWCICRRLRHNELIKMYWLWVICYYTLKINNTHRLILCSMIDSYIMYVDMSSKKNCKGFPFAIFLTTCRSPE